MGAVLPLFPERDENGFTDDDILKMHAHERPRTRGDCVNGPRPCPWASCRHNLLIDLKQRHDSQRAPDVIEYGEVDEIGETCSLDVADAGESTLNDIADMHSCTRERVRQIEGIAMRKIYKSGLLRMLAQAHDLPDVPKSPLIANPLCEACGKSLPNGVTRAHPGSCSVKVARRQRRLR